MTESFHPELPPEAEEYDQALDVPPAEGAYDAGPQEAPEQVATADQGDEVSRWSRVRERMDDMEVGDRLRRVAVAVGAGALEGAGVVQQEEDGQMRPVGIGRALGMVAELAADPRGVAADMAQRAAEGARVNGRQALKAEAARAWADVQRAA